MRGVGVSKLQPVSAEAIEPPDDFRAQALGQRVDAFLRAGFESHDQFVRNRFARRFGPGLPRDLDQLGGFVDRVAIDEQFDRPVCLRQESEVQFAE